MYNSFLSFIIALMLTRNSADARNCYCLASYPSLPPPPPLTPPPDSQSHTQGTQSSLKVQGIKGSTSQTQGPDGTLSATTLNSVKMILEGLTRLRTKVMELNPNFIQHLDVESLLTLFVENFFSSMRGGI